MGKMTFAHTLKATEFTIAELQLLSRHQMVQFDKREHANDMPHSDMEDRFIAAGKQVKAYNPDVRTLFYMNGLLNFGSTWLSNATAVDPDAYLLKNANGAEIKENDMRLFDVRKEQMRQLFVEDAKYAIDSGVFDGIFIDKANFALKLKHGGIGGDWDEATVDSLIPAQLTLLNDLQTALTDEHIVLSKDSIIAESKDWQAANAAMLTDTFCSAYKPKDEGAPKFNKTRCLEEIQFVQKVSQRPMLTQLHAMGPANDIAFREFTMACFLVAAGNLAFFSYVDWDYPWAMRGIHWWPEYDKPVGEPIGMAQRDGWRFTRSFASGTYVTVDLETGTGKISWADVFVV